MAKRLYTYAGKKSELLVTLIHNDNHVEFRRLNRDPQFENQIVSSLLELGLANLDASSFTPLRVKKTENILLSYDLINWLNFNSNALKQLGVDVVQAIHCKPLLPATG